MPPAPGHGPRHRGAAPDAGGQASAAERDSSASSRVLSPDSAGVSPDSRGSRASNASGGAPRRGAQGPSGRGPGSRSLSSRAPLGASASKSSTRPSGVSSPRARSGSRGPSGPFSFATVPAAPGRLGEQEPSGQGLGSRAPGSKSNKSSKERPSGVSSSGAGTVRRPSGPARLNTVPVAAGRQLGVRRKRTESPVFAERLSFRSNKSVESSNLSRLSQSRPSSARGRMETSALRAWSRRSEGSASRSSSSFSSGDSFERAVSAGDVVWRQEVTSSAAQVSLLDTSICNGWLAVGMGIGNNMERVTHDDLQEAAIRGNIPLMRQLIRAGASVNAPMRPESDDEFMTLLHILAMKPELPSGTQVISEIIRGRANLNVRSSLGSTPLSCACSTKHTGAVEILLEAKADASPADDRGCTAVRCAVLPSFDLGRSSQVSGRRESAGAKCVDVLKLLVASGADLDDGGDVPPIVEAVRSLSGDAVTALLEGGATPDGLHDAVAKAPIPIITQLIEAEANPFKKDKDGKSVMEMALARGDEEITTMLRNFVGDLQRKNHPHCLTQDHSQGLENYDHSGQCGAYLRRSRTVGTNQSVTQRTRCYRFCGRRVSKYHEERVKPCCRRLQTSKVFEVSMLVVLIVALFLPDLWVLSDINNDQALDICLTVIMAAFFVELVLQMIGFPDTYTFSFFFWMDLIGLLSVPMDHSLVVNALPTSLDNAVVLRAARMAKLGARASRFTKLVKFLRFLPGMKETANAGTAKVISRSLNMALSTRVSCLIVLMVIVLPLFELAAYPQYDFSMAMWLDLIHDTAYKYPDEVVEVVGDFEVFYRGRSYFPFEIVWDYQNGTAQSLALSGGAPNHRRSEIKVKGEAGSTYAMFNFRGAHQIDSLCNVLLILTIMLMMLGSGLVLSNSVSSIVLTPLEELLGNVKKIASKIFSSVSTIEKGRKRSKDHAQTDDQADGGGLGAETELLDRVLRKLTALSEITVKKSPLDSAEMERLGEADAEMLKSYSVAEGLRVHHDEYQEAEDVVAMVDLPAMQTIQQQLADADVSWSVFDDWDFDSFRLSNAQRRKAVEAIIILRHEHISEGSFLGDWATTCATFVEGVQRGYTSPSTVPYHNWMHAVDATLTMNVMLDLCATGLYFTAYERFALTVAAVAHDIGHPGMNNQFLTQTSHPLAVRYNDSSPLENHHCATLFELASRPGTTIFGDLEKDRYKEVRHYIIEAVLATDYSRHVSLVQQVETLYEMNRELFDTSDEMYRMGVSDFPSREVVDFFRSQDVKRHIRMIFLHYCDVSNPMKSFDIASSWAGIILEEFFMLGDREKEMKMPVQPLNDRDQVNKAYSQVSFIEFFIAPMGIALVRIIPDLRNTVDTLLANLEMWFDLWVRDTDPPPADDERARVTERIVTLQAMYPYFDPALRAAPASSGSTPPSA